MTSGFLARLDTKKTHNRLSQTYFQALYSALKNKDADQAVCGSLVISVKFKNF